MSALSHYACGHCKGFGIHENNAAHPCLACQRTGLLPLVDDTTPVPFPSRKSKEIYAKYMSAMTTDPTPSPLSLTTTPNTDESTPTTTFQIKNKDNFKVVVAGSGIAGAALTLSLQHRGFDVVCFERDTHFNQRAQGYGLTLQQGGAAVRALGVSCKETPSTLLISKHNAWSHTGELVGSYGSLEVGDGSHPAAPLVKSTEAVVEAHQATPNTHTTQPNSKKKAPKHNMIITRQDLRSHMVDNLIPGTLVWGNSVVGYTPQDPTDPNSLLTIHLSNGTTVENCSLLVGCDGIRSSVRQQKMQMWYPMRFLQTFVILGISDILFDSESDPTGLNLGDENYQHRSFVNQASDGCTRIYSMPFDKKTIMWQLSFPIESEQDALALQSTGPCGWLAEAQRRCSHWNLPYVVYMLKHTPITTVTGYPAYDRSMPTPPQLRFGPQFCSSPATDSSSSPSLPLTTANDHPCARPEPDPAMSQVTPRVPRCTSTETSNKRVTLLGDAMHPCSPFKAQGANQALLDAVYCARALTTLFLDENLGDNDTAPTIDELNTVLTKFEREMIERTTPKVMDSRNHIALLHSDATLAVGNMPRAHVAKASLQASEPTPV